MLQIESLERQHRFNLSYQVSLPVQPKQVAFAAPVNQPQQVLESEFHSATIQQVFLLVFQAVLQIEQAL